VAALAIGVQEFDGASVVLQTVALHSDGGPR